MNISVVTIRRMGRPVRQTDKERQREGNQLRQAMDRAGVTQQVLADRLEIEQNLVSQWCTGRTRIPDLTLLRLGRDMNFDALSVRPGLKEYGEFFNGDTLLEGLSHAEKVRIRAVISAFKELPPDNNHTAKG